MFQSRVDCKYLRSLLALVRLKWLFGFECEKIGFRELSCTRLAPTDSVLATFGSSSSPLTGLL